MCEEAETKLVRNNMFFMSNSHCKADIRSRSTIGVFETVFDLSGGGGLGGFNPPSSKPRPPQLSQKKVVGGVEITPPPVI
jgi:hypothetical protein